MIPNILTGIRVSLVLPILLLIGAGRTGAAAAVFAAAILTDMLDGLAARRFNMASTFGAMFDLCADRAIMTPTLIFCAARGTLGGARGIFPLAPWSYVALIVFADVTVIAGVLMYARIRKRDPGVAFPSPPYIVKATYPAQASVVFAALAGLSGVAVTALMFLAAALTIVSFAVYLKKGGFVFKGE
jgi:phosphatidylglycerophosphate synthase